MRPEGRPDQTEATAGRAEKETLLFHQRLFVSFQVTIYDTLVSPVSQYISLHLVAMFLLCRVSNLSPCFGGQFNVDLPGKRLSEGEAANERLRE